MSRSDVEQAKAAAARIDEWDGADHFEDCPALKHADGECDCPEDGCEDPDEGCDCYLGAMRDCRASILALILALDTAHADGTTCLLREESVCVCGEQGWRHCPVHQLEGGPHACEDPLCPRALAEARMSRREEPKPE
jgi:hypothetical protein